MEPISHYIVEEKWLVLSSHDALKML